LKDKTSFNSDAFLDSYFLGIEESFLVEMAYEYPLEFRKLCSLMCLDLQMEKENYGKENNSNRGNMC
jgi:hypothetical protein